MKAAQGEMADFSGKHLFVTTFRLTSYTRNNVSIDILQRNIMAVDGPRGPNAARALCKERL